MTSTSNLLTGGPPASSASAELTPPASAPVSSPHGRSASARARGTQKESSFAQAMDERIGDGADRGPASKTREREKADDDRGTAAATVAPPFLVVLEEPVKWPADGDPALDVLPVDVPAPALAETDGGGLALALVDAAVTSTVPARPADGAATTMASGVAAATPSAAGETGPLVLMPDAMIVASLPVSDMAGEATPADGASPQARADTLATAQPSTPRTPSAFNDITAAASEAGGETEPAPVVPPLSWRQQGSASAPETPRGESGEAASPDARPTVRSASQQAARALLQQTMTAAASAPADGASATPVIAPSPENAESSTAAQTLTFVAAPVARPVASEHASSKAAAAVGDAIQPGTAADTMRFITGIGAGAGSLGQSTGDGSTPGQSHERAFAAAPAPAATPTPASTDSVVTIERPFFDALGATATSDVVAAPLTPRAAAAMPADADLDNEQIVRAMRLSWRGTTGEAQLRLKPDHLGAVTVNVRVEHGQVTTQVRAETAAAQAWIESHQQDLRRALQEQGLTVAQFTVTRDPEERSRRQQPQSESAPAPRARRKDADAPHFEIRI